MKEGDGNDADMARIHYMQSSGQDDNKNHEGSFAKPNNEELPLSPEVIGRKSKLTNQTPISMSEQFKVPTARKGSNIDDIQGHHINLQLNQGIKVTSSH